MSSYTKATNFATKDTLPTGDSNKIVKGTEIDNEFNAISGAISSKADIASPTFTGTPAGPTATTGSNTTQLANTAYVKQEITALGTIGTMAAQDSDDVTITGGDITGITDLAVADGGTGRSTLTDKAVLIGAGTSGITSVSPGSSGNVLKSDGTNWTSAAPTAVEGLGLGGETWQNVGGSRSMNTNYTNNETYPIMVTVVMVNSNGAYFYINDSLVWHEWYDVNTGAGQTGYGTATAIIPPGATYRAAAGNLNSWWELR